MSMEFHIPISPTPHFFNSILATACSLRELGGGYADATIHVSVGADEEPWNIAANLPWSKDFPVQWHWIARDDFCRRSYYATSTGRYSRGFQSDIVIFLDADTLILRQIDDLLAEASRCEMIGGLIAHASPFREKPQRGQHAWWNHLYAGLNLGPAFMGYEHTGWGLFGEAVQYRLTPAYYNYGMILGTNAVMRELAQVMNQTVTYCLEQDCGFFSAQVALALAIQQVGAPARPFPFRFNCSNWGIFETKFSDEIADAGIAHFHSPGGVNRQTDFVSIAALKEFARKAPMHGVNGRIQSRIATLLPLMQDYA
ncbi:hypothetical protein [Ferrovibrio sp.]|uniref:hypothetical protein n=1 Tax=Ferrovibrio sp. TaxID=1917215 RepID=UPI0035ADE1D7